jgi:GntR family transcriptional regulator
MTERTGGRPPRPAGRGVPEGRAVGRAGPGRGRGTAQYRPTMRRVLAEIREVLVRGELAPGDRLPSETELAARFGVARTSVREALKVLESEGIVNVRHGRGRFVSALAGLAVTSPITVFESVTEMLGDRGLSVTTRVLSAERARPDSAEARALHLGPGDEVLRLHRIRLGGGEIVIYSLNVFPADLLGDRDVTEMDFSGSITELLAAAGRRPVSSAAHLRATALPPEIAARPEAGRRHRAWLSIEELCIDAAGEPVLQSLDYHRGDLFSFHVLRRRGSNQLDQQGATRA